MNVGDLVFFRNDIGMDQDYSIVTTSKDHVYWAYWVKEKSRLSFIPSKPCYTKIGPSVLGKWS